MHIRRIGAARSLALLTLVSTLSSGCANTLGPQLIVNSHVEYNQAVAQVLREELLLNVVRRRYQEAPQFVYVSSISTNLETTTQGEAALSVDDLGDANIVDGAVQGSVTFQDSPTVTLTPRHGEDIASQLHEPLEVSALVDLVDAGYPLRGALIALVQGMNSLSGIELRYEGFQPNSPEWTEAVDLLERFYESGELIVHRFRWNDPYNDYAFPADSISPEMWITTLSTGARRWKSYDGGETFYFTTHEMAPAFWLEPKARRTPEGERLLKLLNVQPDVQKRIWILEPARVGSGPDLEENPDRPRPTLKLRMRSLYNVLNLFSFGVQVPRRDEDEGRASDLSSYRAAVERGDLRDLQTNFVVRSSETAPDSAYEAVRYRDHWFYIDDRDLRSKMAFNALYDLWQLSIKSPSSQSTPVTTIQVN